MVSSWGHLPPAASAPGEVALQCAQELCGGEEHHPRGRKRRFIWGFSWGFHGDFMDFMGILLGFNWLLWDLNGIWMGFDLGLQKRFYFWFFSWGFYWDFMGDSWDLGFPPHQGYLNGANNDKPRGFAVPYVQTKPYIVGVETKEILVVSRVVTRICYSWFTVHHNGDWLLQWSCMSVCWGLLSSEVFINSVRRIDDGIG